MATRNLFYIKSNFKLELRALKKRLLKELTVDTITRTVMLKIGNEAVRIIRQRTRSGFGVNYSNSKIKLDSLSDEYVERRRRYRGLSPNTTPEKSNLTFTGQMLDSLQVNKVSQGRSYIAPSGSRNGGGNNLRVGEFVSVKRPFNNLSSGEIKDLAEFYKSIIGAK